MRTVAVVVVDVGVKNVGEVAGIDDEEMIEALTTDGAHPSFGECVRVRRPHRGADDLGVDRAPNVVEGPGELGVTVADQMRDDTPPVLEDPARLRACWVTQAPDGFVVIPQTCTRRVSISMKNST